MQNFLHGQCVHTTQNRWQEYFSGNGKFVGLQNYKYKRDLIFQNG